MFQYQNKGLKAIVLFSSSKNRVEAQVTDSHRSNVIKLQQNVLTETNVFPRLSLKIKLLQLI